MCLFKRKEQKRKTVFDLPVDDSMNKLSSIVDDVYRILNNKKFVGALEKIKVPKNATRRDLEAVWYGAEVANKVKEFINVFLVEERESILNILSTIFCESKEEYRKKSLSEIVDDIAKLTQDEKGQIFAFFLPA